jgi:hypothetical protein
MRPWVSCRSLAALVATTAILCGAVAVRADPGTNSSSQPKASAQDTFTFDDVQASLSDFAAEDRALSKVDAATNVVFVELHLVRGFSSDKVNFTPDQAKNVDALRSAIGRNNPLMRKLHKAGYLLNEVVALRENPPGVPYIFIDL